APDCPVPPGPFAWRVTRPPVLADLWETAAPAGAAFTTVATWRNVGKDVEFRGERYVWSKDVNFRRFIDAPRRTGAAFEVALESADLDAPARLRARGWSVVEARAVSRDVEVYRDYVRGSRGEFTVAKDLVVRTRSGWFSDRSACYLAAGRPVITQDTGLGSHVPTGRGLFAFRTLDDVAAAVQAIAADPARHAAAARELAREYFGAERLLGAILADAGV
ncbi:MAG TPA: hypothetical protein VFX28_23105, partial [Methylomirabilota bacterium]|nr:hypothetical protein [Methylomirabilota bacterium]